MKKFKNYKIISLIMSTALAISAFAPAVYAETSEVETSEETYEEYESDENVQEDIGGYGPGSIYDADADEEEIIDEMEASGEDSDMASNLETEIDEMPESYGEMAFTEENAETAEESITEESNDEDELGGEDELNGEDESSNDDEIMTDDADNTDEEEEDFSIATLSTAPSVYGFYPDTYYDSTTFKLLTPLSRNEDGTNTYTFYFLCDGEESWLDSNITFSVEDVTPVAYREVFQSAGISSSISIKKSSAESFLKKNSFVTVPGVFKSGTYYGTDKKATSGKMITVTTSAAVRALKITASKNGKTVDTLYAICNGTDSSFNTVDYDKELYRQTRRQIEAKLWTDNMTDKEKLLAVATYIRNTTHYPNTDATSKEANPEFWSRWSVDGLVLQYTYSQQDTYLNELMILQGGITTCTAAGVLYDIATEDLGLKDLKDSGTGKIASGEGVYLGLGSESSNPNNIGHVSLVYIDSDGSKLFIDAQGMSTPCSQHNCTGSVVSFNYKFSYTSSSFGSSSNSNSGSASKSSSSSGSGSPSSSSVLNGVCKASDGCWYFYKNGVKQTSYTGFATNSNGKWYVENGKVTKKANGVFKDTKGAIGSKNEWYYVVGSKVQTGFTGLANYKNSSGWWYITKGKVDRSYNGLAKNKNGWYYLTNGKVDRSYTGFAKNSNGKWYVEKGKVTKKTNGVFKDSKGSIGSKTAWYYVVGSKVQTGFTGLANYKNSSGWWYITKGKVDRSYTGIAKNKNGTWYVKNGKVDRSYTGSYVSANKKYTISRGKVTKTVKI